MNFIETTNNLAKRIHRKHGVVPFWGQLDSLRLSCGDWLAARSPGQFQVLLSDPLIREARRRCSFIDGAHPSRILPLP